jgi:sulfite reductase (NADPH) flavoprotein alpha-component
MAALKKELCEWMEQGASLYVSGTRDPMSVDVENALLKIFESQGRSEAESKRYLEGLKDENRYLLDVY